MNISHTSINEYTKHFQRMKLCPKFMAYKNPLEVTTKQHHIKQQLQLHDDDGLRLFVCTPRGEKNMEKEIN